MGIVTKYFGTESVGSGDGSDFNNRKQLLPGGIWNTDITAHNFNGSDSLVCVLEAASYNIPAISFTSGSPTTVNRLSFVAGSASGLWTPPNPRWNCCQPIWDTTGMYEFNTTVNNTLTLNGIDCFGGKLFSNFNGPSYQNITANWCYFKNTNNGTSAYANYSGDACNCVMEHTAGNYLAVVYHSGGGRLLNNCRIIGSMAGTLGTRYGIFGVTSRIANVCIINALEGVTNNTGGNSIGLERCTIISTGAVGTIGTRDRGNATQSGQLVNNLFHNLATGISNTDVTKTKAVRGNVFNSVTTMQSGNGNWNNTDLNTVSSASASDLFVDPTNGDYRIKRSSPYWGKGIGAGDEPIGLPLIGSGSLVY